MRDKLTEVVPELSNTELRKVIELLVANHRSGPVEQVVGSIVEDVIDSARVGNLTNETLNLIIIRWNRKVK